MTQDIKRLLLWLLAGLIIIGSIILIMFSAKPTIPNDPTETISVELIEQVNDKDWKRGAASGKVTIVEYSDFQCPACGYWSTEVEKLVDEFGSDLTFVYRHLPLKSIHKNAELAALASEAAGLQGKFWEMHDKLFENQNVWSKLTGNDFKAQLANYAKDLGLDTAKFAEDLESDEVADKVNEDLASANRLGLNSTPSFFFDGKLIRPDSPAGFRNLVREALK